MRLAGTFGDYQTHRDVVSIDVVRPFQPFHWGQEHSRVVNCQRRIVSR